MASTDAIAADRIWVALGGRTVLHGANMTARHGEITAVLGPNGAGKTTLLRALAGLVYYEGAIHVDGRHLDSLSRAERARTITYVPQRSKLASPFKVEYVVRQGRYAQGDKHPDSHRLVDEAMQRVDVESLRARPFTQLSGGEQRRVLLARALATGARIILLDEPTASLDVGHALAFFRLTRELADHGYAIIVVLHRLQDAVDFTDQAFLLKEGKVLRSGATRVVVTADAVREAYGVELEQREALGFRAI